jgi:hypothetical protein
MQNKISGAALLFLLLLLSGRGGAQGYSAEMDLNSRYVWRGLAYSSGAVLQPSLNTSLADLKVSLWDNYDLNASNPFNELDLYLTYPRQINGLTIEPTLQFYTYPNNGAVNTGELALKLAYPLWMFSAYTTQVVDVQLYGGACYSDLGLSYSTEVRPEIPLVASIYTGWGNTRFNESYLGFSKSAHNVIGADCCVTFSPVKGINVRPHINYSRLVDTDLRAAVTFPPSILNVGVAVGGEF